MVEQLVELEKNWFLTLNSPHTPYLDGVMYMISDKYPWIVVGAIFLFLMLYKQKPKECVVFLLAVVLCIFIGDQLSSHIIKPLFSRFRPTHHPLTEAYVKTVLDYRGGNFGFISGHSTNFISFATFTALLLRDRVYTLISFVVALTVCYSRIYLGVHFISDVIPGILCGLMVGWFVYLGYIRSRVLFLGIPEEHQIVPYVHPRSRIRYFSYLLLIFYVLLWAISPLLFPLYS